MRLLEQHRHLAHDRAGFADAGDNRLALEHLEPSRHQYIKVPGGAALANDDRACGHVPLTSTRAVIESPAHRYLRASARLGERLRSGGIDNAACLLKFSAGSA